MSDPEMGEAPQNNKIFQKKIMREILLLLVKEFLSKEVNKLSFGDHIDINGKDYLEVPLAGTGLDLYFESIRFTCEIVHECGDNYKGCGKRTDPKFFKLGFCYRLSYGDHAVLHDYVYLGNKFFKETVGTQIIEYENLPEFPKNFFMNNGSYIDKSEFDYKPGTMEKWVGCWDKKTVFWKEDGSEDNCQPKRYIVKEFMGRTRYEIITSLLEWWNSWMETLEFLCYHGFKAAQLGEVLTKKYPGLVYFGRKVMNSYIYTAYSKYESKKDELGKWKRQKFDEYSGRFEWENLDVSVKNRLCDLITGLFGYTIWEDIRFRNKLLTEEDVQIINQLDETAFRGSYPSKTFKDFVLESIDQVALPSGQKELPYKGLEFVQYAESID